MSEPSSPAPVALKMARPNLEKLPDYPLPSPFALRWYLPGDDEHWLRIHLQADRLNSIHQQLFAEQFGADVGSLRERQCYLLHGQLPIGTATAWFKDDFEGGSWGRVHWVAILPEYQGRGLAKPLLSATCRRLRELGHVRAYLTTSSSRKPAIHLYHAFGFLPLVHGDTEAAAWRHLGFAV